jgi:5-methylcytosine-specific restriction endonuclease McrA
LQDPSDLIGQGIAFPDVTEVAIRIRLHRREQAVSSDPPLRQSPLACVLLLLALVFTGCRGPVSPTAVEPTPIPNYNRDEWRHWIDADGDCQDTRQEVLIEESLTPVVFVDARECRVLSGIWRDAYSGMVYTDPSLLHVDHLVPLENAHRSGGWGWSIEQKRDYANDLIDRNHLIAVHQSLNSQKGSRTPTMWRPPDRGAWCAYARAWIGVKERWALSVVAEEQAALVEMQASCS